MASKVSLFRLFPVGLCAVLTSCAWSHTPALLPSESLPYVSAAAPLVEGPHAGAGPVVPSSDVSVGSPSAWDQEQDPLTALLATAARGVTEDLPVDAMIITGSHVLFTEYLEDVREALEVAGPTCEIEECVETGVAVVLLDFKRLETRLETGGREVMVSLTRGIPEEVRGSIRWSGELLEVSLVPRREGWVVTDILVIGVS